MCNIRLLALMVYIQIVYIIASSGICIPGSQDFINAEHINDYHGDFDFSGVNLHQIHEYLKAFGKVHMDNLQNEHTCEKGCSLHVNCGAYSYDHGAGCDLWVTEIQNQGIIEGESVYGIQIGIQMLHRCSG